MKSATCLIVLFVSLLIPCQAQSPEAREIGTKIDRISALTVALAAERDAYAQALLDVAKLHEPKSSVIINRHLAAIQRAEQKRKAILAQIGAGK